MPDWLAIVAALLGGGVAAGAAFYIVGRRAERQVAGAAARAAAADSARLLEDARQRLVLAAKEELMRAREAWDGEAARRPPALERRDDQIEMKGRIIGREGRNIRAFEAATGVDVIIDDTPDTVVVSCFDPVRREVGRLALERLIADGRIHPGRIEEIIGKCRAEIEAGIVEAGEQAVYETGIKGMHPDRKSTRLNSSHTVISYAVF